MFASRASSLLFRRFPASQRVFSSVGSVEVLSLAGDDGSTRSSGELTEVLAPLGARVQAGDAVAVVDGSVRIRAPRAGKIIDVAAQVGDTVHLKDVLFQIEMEEGSLLERLEYHLNGNHGKLDEEGDLWKKKILQDLEDIDKLHGIASFLGGGNVEALRPKALAIYRRILQLHQSQKSPTSMVATTALRLGTLLHSLGDSDSALGHLVQAVKLHQKSSHPDTLRAQLQLATVYGETNQVPKAIEVLESALEDEHPPFVAAEVQSMLANLHHRQGSFDDALKAYQTSLDFYLKEDKSEDSDRIASIHHAMGLVQAQKTSTGLASGQLDQTAMVAGFEGALASFRESLDRRLTSTDAATQIQLAASHMAIAQVLADALGRDLDEASQHVQSAVVIWQQASDLPRVAAGYNHLGAIAYQQEDYPRAVDYYGEALSVLEETLGATDKNHPDLAAAHNNIGLALMQSGDLDGARKKHQIGLEMLEQNQEGDPNRLAVTLGSLGNVSKAQEDFEDALDYYQRAHKLLTGGENGDAPQNVSPLDVASSHNSQGAVLVELGRLDDALGEYRKARDVFASRLGEGHPHTASCHYNLGLVWHLKQDYQKAALEYELARHMWADALGSDHLQVRVADQAIEAAKDDLNNQDPMAGRVQ